MGVVAFLELLAFRGNLGRKAMVWQIEKSGVTGGAIRDFLDI